MFRSLQRIKKLQANTVILPGHHYRDEHTSTLEIEMTTSPPLQCKTVEELAALP
jgi:glyoxylase-like metal-dependent hydrolase (beta-lactamase superfamily II)